MLMMQLRSSWDGEPKIPAEKPVVLVRRSVLLLATGQEARPGAQAQPRAARSPSLRTQPHPWPAGAKDYQGHVKPQLEAGGSCECGMLGSRRHTQTEAGSSIYTSLYLYIRYRHGEMGRGTGSPRAPPPHPITHTQKQQGRYMWQLERERVRPGLLRETSP